MTIETAVGDREEKDGICQLNAKLSVQLESSEVDFRIEFHSQKEKLNRDHIII